jgi:hypothetical protein
MARVSPLDTTSALVRVIPSDFANQSERNRIEEGGYVGRWSLGVTRW